jgi:divalent metal cation (Fe/Co/Zn/Cd) transporter
VLGRPVWLGWLMMAALAYSAVPPIVLWRAKRRLALDLHAEALQADAAMNRSDCLTSVAAVPGTFEVGLADSLAAAAISLAVIHDGVQGLVRVVRDLIDEVPTSVGTGEGHRVLDRVRERLFTVVPVRRLP